MLYPADFEKKIGFDQIRELLEGFCLSEPGRSEVGKMDFSSDLDEITTRLTQTEEFRQILLSGSAFPVQSFTDPTPLLNRLCIENTFPEPEELSEFRTALMIFLDILDFFTEERIERYPTLTNLLEGSQMSEVRSQMTDTREKGRGKREQGTGTREEGKGKREQGTGNREDSLSNNSISGIKDPISGIRHPSSVIRHPASGIRHPASGIRHPASGIRYPVSGIRDLIDSVLDEKSQVRDSASRELAGIRSDINRLHGGIQKKMNQLFGEARRNGWTDADTDLTVRDGRLVIPFRSAHKRKIPGVVLDESATGQTVFVEPIELFEMNNEIRELRYAERREIIRILTRVADEIRPLIPDLTEVNHLLGAFDFIRAKALLAIRTGGVRCSRVLDRSHLQWFHAVHPLLYLTHKKAGKVVVPQDITLDGNGRVLVISGPNAGGKSICLKTVGLLQYMVQSGLLPPAREDSEFGIFRQIMIDIGDEQSLENDLSTYTSKLLNMKFFLEHLDDRSLFLIDEMGSGTDPSVGGAIAEAALLTMAGTGAYGVVTTHYSNLKLLAGDNTDSLFAIRHSQEEGDSPFAIRHSQEAKSEERKAKSEQRRANSEQRTTNSGIVNAAMLFDTKTMKPLYILMIGKPGSSFAVEIARSIGFPEAELGRASELIGGSQLDFEQQLQELEVEKAEVAKKAKEMQVADEFIGELIVKYEQQIAEVERSRNGILEKAREEARQLLQDSNKLIERTIKEIRESQADKERTKKARASIKDALLKMPDDRYQMPDKKDHPASEKDHLASGIRHPGSESKRFKSSYTDIITSKQEVFTLTLDLRGKRAEEAFTDLQRFIDDASLLSVKEVRILHGKGTGALREVTRNYLKGRNEVQGFRDEEIERGGGGITVVTLY